MAFSVVVSEKTVFGNMNVQMGVLTADATAGSVALLTGKIRHAVLTPKSVTSGYKVALNAGPSGTSTVGTLAVTGCTSGDELYFTVYGA